MVPNCAGACSPFRQGMQERSPGLLGAGLELP